MQWQWSVGCCPHQTVYTHNLTMVGNKGSSHNCIFLQTLKSQWCLQFLYSYNTLNINNECNFCQQWYTPSSGVQTHNKQKIPLLSTMFRKCIIRWEQQSLLVSTKGHQVRVTTVTFLSNLYKVKFLFQVSTLR